MRNLIQLFLAAGVLLVPIAASPAAKPKRESVYTDIMGKDCIERGVGGLSCEGPGGWFLDIDDEGNIIELRIWRGKANEASLELIGRSLGEKAEWRGVRTRKGFRPDALIVRMRPLEEDGKDSSLLHIFRLNLPEACFSGIVDAKANANANQIAREGADKLTSACDPYPQVFGKRSAATDMYGS